jgi:hypothetical protein
LTEKTENFHFQYDGSETEFVNFATIGRNNLNNLVVITHNTSLEELENLGYSLLAFTRSKIEESEQQLKKELKEKRNQKRKIQYYEAIKTTKSKFNKLIKR